VTEFGDPFISLERLKLKTPNLAHRLATGGPNEKMQIEIRSKGVMKGSRDLLLKFWDPSISLQRWKLETSNLARTLATETSLEKCKIRSKGVVKGHVTYFLKFLDSLHISATVEAINFKFGTQIGHWGYQRRNAKLDQTGSRRGHVTYFLKFRTPSISRQRLKL